MSDFPLPPDPDLLFSEPVIQTAIQMALVDARLQQCCQCHALQIELVEQEIPQSDVSVLTPDGRCWRVMLGHEAGCPILDLVAREVSDASAC